MSRFHSTFAAALVAGTVFSAAGWAGAQEYLPSQAAVAQAPTHATHPHADAWRPRYPEQAIAPYAGNTNHSHLAPTFRWGWFGAEHHYPGVHWHRTYIGEHLRWSTQRRY